MHLDGVLMVNRFSQPFYGDLSPATLLYHNAGLVAQIAQYSLYSRDEVPKTDVSRRRLEK
jgi:hypothetical protein